MSNRSNFIAFIIVLLACLPGFFTGGGSVYAQALSADSTTVVEDNKRGDINLDGALDIMDLLSLLGKITGRTPQEPSDDLNGDGKVNIIDLLALLREMAQLRDSGEQEFEAIVKINSHLLCEPNVYVFYPFREFWPASEGGKMRARYEIHANREIERVEFILAGDTLYAPADTTPVLVVIDPDSQQTASGFAESELKEWKLKAWDNRGNCFTDSGDTRFFVTNFFATDMGGSPNTGLPIEFPLVLHGLWQRFGLVHPASYGSVQGSLLPVDLNREEADSVVFDNIDQLSEAVMEEITANLPFWEFDSMRESGPFVSSAVLIETGEKSNSLLFDFRFPFNGGYIDVAPLDGNERLMSALGFPRWIRELPGYVTNHNFKLDPDIFEKYKDRVD